MGRKKRKRPSIEDVKSDTTDLLPTFSDRVVISPEEIAEAKYYFRDGYRCVRPYPFIFKVNAKGRWYGKNILELLISEFKGNDLKYYKKALEIGLILVNNKTVSEDYTLKEHDRISHHVHRHEPPVNQKDVHVIAITNRLVVVDKPPSLPVHPCGRYRHNSVLNILDREKSIRDIYIVHRLDRLTSGLLVFARSPHVSREIAAIIKRNEVTKVYLAKVEGFFPDETSVEQPIAYVKRGKSKKQNAVDPKGKYALTHFKREHYDGTHSIVRCFPKTGRTHQIRIHLAWLGFPILNDPLYNDDCHFKDDYVFEDIDPSILENPDTASSEDLDPIENMVKDFPHCFDCKRHYRDPSQDEMLIYLHALSYTIEGVCYQTELPEWASVLQTTNKDQTPES